MLASLLTSPSDKVVDLDVKRCPDEGNELVDQSGVEPLTSPVRVKQSPIPLPGQTPVFPLQTSTSAVINDHGFSPVRISSDDQMMTWFKDAAVAKGDLTKQKLH